MKFIEPWLWGGGWLACIKPSVAVDVCLVTPLTNSTATEGLVQARGWLILDLGKTDTSTGGPFAKTPGTPWVQWVSFCFVMTKHRHEWMPVLNALIAEDWISNQCVSPFLQQLSSIHWMPQIKSSHHPCSNYRACVKSQNNFNWNFPLNCSWVLQTCIGAGERHPSLFMLLKLLG